MCHAPTKTIMAHFGNKIILKRTRGLIYDRAKLLECYQNERRLLIALSKIQNSGGHKLQTN